MSLHGFVIPRCGYFITFELFSNPKGRESDQKIAKKFKCRTSARSLPPVLKFIPALTFPLIINQVQVKTFI